MRLTEDSPRPGVFVVDVGIVGEVEADRHGGGKRPCDRDGVADEVGIHVIRAARGLPRIREIEIPGSVPSAHNFLTSCDCSTGSGRQSDPSTTMIFLSLSSRMLP